MLSPYRCKQQLLHSTGMVCLEALQDYLLSRSSSTRSPGSSRHSCSSHCKLSPLCGTLLSSGDLFMSGGYLKGLRRSSNLTTWKQVSMCFCPPCVRVVFMTFPPNSFTY